MKYQISRAYFDTLNGRHELVQSAIDTPEIQSTSVEEIAVQSALWACRQTGEPSIKSDAGCFIESVNGFPGPFLKYVNDWLTQEDYISLLSGKDNRRAYFEDALAIAYPDGTTHVFSQKVYGTIAETVDPNATRWSMDALFIPDSAGKTLGSMTDEEQVAFWGDGNWPDMIRYLESLPVKDDNTF